MSYSNFTLPAARTAFQLEEEDIAGLFSNIDPITPSELLKSVLALKVPLATAIATEKAKSELIVSDVLVELREQLDHSISLFSGIDFNVDEELGLTGVCAFVISLSPIQFDLQAPIIVLVEAKNDNLEIGLGQCVAEMVAAQHFNSDHGNDIPRVYGATTSGTEWRFLKLEGKKLKIDMLPYQIGDCDKVLGILSSMVAQTA